MGTGNYCGCDCTGSERRNEFDLRASTASLAATKQEKNAVSEAPITVITPKSAVKANEPAPLPSAFSPVPDYKRIGDLTLASWRGYQARKAFAILVKQAQVASQYFSREYTRETLLQSHGTRQRTNKTFTYSNGASYTGEWCGGFRDGKGAMAWPGGARFEGIWSWGWPVKIGTFTSPDGDTFQGLWLNPYEEGRRSLFIDSQSSLQVWKNTQGNGYLWLWYKENLQSFNPSRLIRESMSPDNKKAQLTAKFAKVVSMIESLKERFRGGFGPSALLKAGLRTYREAKYENGSSYMGEFDGDAKDGHGKLISANGDIYEGEWKADEHDGIGQNKWSDGASYIGCYAKGKKVGVGEYLWEEGSRYIGEWGNNSMHGVGNYSWPDKREFLGEWKEGLMDGYGIFRFPDGRTFEGPFLKGKKHGDFLSTKDGHAIREQYRNGKLQKATDST